ncbi:MAG: universal stress protein [Burkholderiaceae bacterium]|nr:MAG: universal stress protein [Burkholderiaceae bacterium]
MAFKTILVQLDHEARSNARLGVALQLTRAFDAHLIGLHVDQYPITQMLALEGMDMAATQALLDEGERQAALAGQLFERAVPNAGWSKYEWRAVTGMVEQQLTAHARYADLLVLGQPDPHNHDYPRLTRDYPATLSLHVARPVLVVPYAGTFETVGQQIMVAWNGSRESTRAVTDALPLLQRASNVTITTVDDESRAVEDRIYGSDLGLYLARHGVRAEVAQLHGGPGSTGDRLLSRAAELDVDLIVMGSYGHWRMRELALGGVTRTLSRNMTIPVLFSH